MAREEEASLIDGRILCLDCKPKIMRIVLNTNTELIKQQFDGDIKDAPTFLDCFLVKNIFRQLDLADISADPCSFFSAWQGGKHFRAQTKGTLWCSHHKLTDQQYETIESIICNEIQEATKATKENNNDIQTF
tara:strand:+ start:422 stop:820 length:399 start_codon:yes stop_codon:yes gene_type:complete